MLCVFRAKARLCLADVPQAEAWGYWDFVFLEIKLKLGVIGIWGFDHCKLKLGVIGLWRFDLFKLKFGVIRGMVEIQARHITFGKFSRSFLYTCALCSIST